MLDQTTVSQGLAELGLDGSSTVLVHASLRSFGHVAGGAATVCRALAATCGTVMMLAGSGDLTRVPAPPGLIRPHNAYFTADSWPEFDEIVASRVPFAADLPVDKWLGTIAETMRCTVAHERGAHPLLSFLATGTHARRLVAAQRVEWPLGPIEELAALGGDVLLLGVGHTSNTTIHLAEQRLGRARFYRYAIGAPGVWQELPNIPGDSHRFEEIEPHLRAATAETRIGSCHARRIPATEVLRAADRLIRADPGAMLCDDPDCRCTAALQQRLAAL